MDRAFPTGEDRRRHRWLALVGLLAFILHGALKARTGLLGELLWGCNLSSLALIAGFATSDARLVGPAFVWRLGLGEPGFLLGLWSGERFGWTTGLVHVIPTLLAGAFLRRSGLPQGAALRAFAASLVMVGLGRLAPPPLNVNLAYALPGGLSWSLALPAAGLMLALAETLGVAWAGRPDAR